MSFPLNSKGDNSVILNHIIAYMSLSVSHEADLLGSYTLLDCILYFENIGLVVIHVF